jgi:putative ABC transport system permease protein
MLTFLSRNELWTPLAFAPNQLTTNQRGHQYLDVIARLKPGITLAAAHADLKSVAAQMSKDLPDWYPSDWSIEAAPLSARVSGPIRNPLLVLVGAVGLVLLIGCVNVSNLLLARASGRQKEITIRTALGASRWRVVRQLLLESVLIAVVSGALGLLASVWILDLFERFGPQGLLRGQHLTLNLAVAAFTLLISLLSTFLFGLAPAIAVSRVDLHESLNETSRGASGGPGKQRMRSVLVASEVALSLTLLISAGLLIRSFQSLQHAAPGFNPARVLTFQVSLPAADYRDAAAIRAFYGQLLARLSSLPGVSSVGAVSVLPFSGSNSGGTFDIVGRSWDPSKPIPDVGQHRASTGYFAAMRIPVMQGRTFTESDGPDAPKVAVVDEPFVRRIFPNEDPLGKQITGPDSRTGYTIIGVVGGVKHNSLSIAPEATIYYPWLQAPNRTLAVTLRTKTLDPLNMISAVRAQVRALNRNLPIYRVMSMEQWLNDSLDRTRFSTTLLSVLAVLALLLASIGIYGVVGYTVIQRNHEIGIRMALGARPGDAIRLVLQQSAVPVVAGLAAGVVVSLSATRLLKNLLYEVSATDPLVFAALSLFLAGVACLACYLPARKATKVDPMVALRYE